MQRFLQILPEFHFYSDSVFALNHTVQAALGATAIDEDLVNVSKVLKMNGYTKINHLVRPLSLPVVFTGLRFSHGGG